MALPFSFCAPSRVHSLEVEILSFGDNSRNDLRSTFVPLSCVYLLLSLENAKKSGEKSELKRCKDDIKKS